MKLSGMKQLFSKTGLVLGAAAAFGLSACDGDTITIPMGDYKGAGYYYEDLGGNAGFDYGFLYAEVTIEGGEVSGTVEIYADPDIESVPSGTDTFELTGSTSGGKFSAEIPDIDVTVTGTLDEAGFLSAEFASNNPEFDMFGSGIFIPVPLADDGSEIPVAIGCGSYGFGGEGGSSSGSLAILADGEGSVYGVLGDTSGNFSAVLTGTYSGGDICPSESTCGNDIEFEANGTFDEDPISLTDNTASLTFYDEGYDGAPFDRVYGGGGIANDDFSGGFGFDTPGCDD